MTTTNTPDLHIGDSAFESWYSSYNPMHKGDKQRARDAYAAGMGDSLVMAAPAAVAGPVAVLKFERGTPGRENEMPRVVSCNWMPDGEYEVYRAAAPTVNPAPQQEVPAVGNSGFDHKTAADFLTGKTVSDEAVRKFVAASRWAHDDRAGLQATLLSVRRELASREAEIALLKTALPAVEARIAAEAALFTHSSGIKGGQHVD